MCVCVGGGGGGVGVEGGCWGFDDMATISDNAIMWSFHYFNYMFYMLNIL